ncbi:hypothetical protein CHS0354_003459 [Potamilus streckersoni]|uniref:C2H2-type domain-containing protein n=1 Tax=Potamilus streckersoni TaxID=2493646 RepID=A0AAE0VZ30_9BIVA|nr:hypothetical protein CHS0354_003459 [Potamilus streckersoni]
MDVRLDTGIVCIKESRRTSKAVKDSIVKTDGKDFVPEYKTDESSPPFPSDSPQDSQLNLFFFSCVLCNAVFEHKLSLKGHMKTHTGQKPYKCDYCEMMFQNAAHLVRHVRKHTGEKPFKCEICNNSFAVKGNLDRHRKMHTGEKPYQCEICNQSFTTKRNLERHFMVHTGEKPFKCPLCEQSFTQKGSLDRHLKIHSGTRPWKCEICSKSFIQRASLEYHSIRHTGEKKYPCETCGKHFARSADLKRHVQINTCTRVFNCDKCHKMFKGWGNWRSHKCKSKNSNSKHAYSCKVCKETFIDRKDLQSHEKKKHRVDEQHWCKMCGIAFERRRVLKSHELTCKLAVKVLQNEEPDESVNKNNVHHRENLSNSNIQEKLYKCDECNILVVSKSKESIDEHKAIHSLKLSESAATDVMHLKKHLHSPFQIKYECNYESIDTEHKLLRNNNIHLNCKLNICAKSDKMENFKCEECNLPVLFTSRESFIAHKAVHKQSHCN